MELKKYSLEVKYKITPSVFDWKASFIEKILGGKDFEFPLTKKEDLSNQQVNIKIQNQDADLLINPSRWLLRMDAKDIKGVKKLSLLIYQRMMAALNWEGDECMVVASVWALPVKKDFEKSLAEIKSKAFVSTSIVEQATDIALSFTFKEGSDTIAYNCGIMPADEYKQRYNVECKSDAMFVVEMRYEIPMSAKMSEDELSKSLDHCMSYMENKASISSENYHD